MDRDDRKMATGFDRTVQLAAGAPSATLVSADTAFPFAQPVKSVLIQNNTAAALYANFDQVASPGTLYVAAGQTLIIDWPCQVLHLYAALAAGVNGAVAGALFVGGSI